MKLYSLTKCTLLAVLAFLPGCTKDDSDENTPAISNKQVIQSFCEHIAAKAYYDLANESGSLYNKVIAFNSNPTANLLEDCRNSWRSTRLVWEKTESFLFGPVATENIDPRIDTWPVNFNDLEVVLANGIPFSESYIDGLDDALKGFHPIEYLLFGQSGTKSVNDFTLREHEYLAALALNLKSLTSQLASKWDSQVSSSFYYEFYNAGNGSSGYPELLSAYKEIINAMAGICDEVANGKINEPFTAQNPDLEESPFAKNSIADFTNNIKGVQSVYTGNFGNDTYGVEDFVKQHNLALDNTIKTKINNAIAALNNITVPFGEAITTQPVQVQQSIDAINELKSVIETDLMQLVQQHIN